MGLSSINDYINSLDDYKRGCVYEFVAFLETEFPEITPKISFSMPMWWVGNKMYDGYVGISPAKKHYSIHFHDESYISILKELLPDCSFGKKCINVKYDDGHSISVVKQKVKDYMNSIL